MGQNSLDAQQIQTDESGNIIIKVPPKSPPQEVQDENRSLQEGSYSQLKDKVLQLMKQYQEQYPECIYIPPKLIPDEGIEMRRETQECRENFKRGWIMGTNWAKLFFMNNYSKEEGWAKLKEIKEFFVEKLKTAKQEFECALKGLKKGYFNNFELLEDDSQVIPSFEDFIQVKYANLEAMYEKLYAKVTQKEVPKNNLTLDD